MSRRDPDPQYRNPHPRRRGNPRSPAIAGYSSLLGKPLAAIKSRKSLTQQLDAEFAAADALLEKQIDPLVATLEVEFPSLVADYANAQRLGSTGTRSTEPSTDAPATPG